MENICIIIPTKDRPEDIKNLLGSLQIQTKKPEQIIVVDGSDKPIREVVERFSDLAIDYVAVALLFN